VSSAFVCPAGSSRTEQLQHRKDVFIPAPPVPGAIVFNIGDFLMRWSNDELKSTLHRVRAPPRKEGDESEYTKERYSIPWVSALGFQVGSRITMS
jgi:isopenicillin N synthase-like dioxygenase